MAKVLGDNQAEVHGGVDVQEIIEVVAGRVLEAIDDQGDKEHKSHREVRSISSPSPATTIFSFENAYIWSFGGAFLFRTWLGNL